MCITTERKKIKRERERERERKSERMSEQKIKIKKSNYSDNVKCVI